MGVFFHTTTDFQDPSLNFFYVTFCLCSARERFFAEFEDQKEIEFFFTQIQKCFELKAAKKKILDLDKKNLISF